MQLYDVADLALSGYLRVVTDPKAFRVPTPINVALKLIAAGARPLRHLHGVVPHGRSQGGELIADVYFAALAIEHNCEWLSCDLDSPASVVFGGGGRSLNRES